MKWTYELKEPKDKRSVWEKYLTERGQFAAVAAISYIIFAIAFFYIKCS